LIVFKRLVVVGFADGFDEFSARVFVVPVFEFEKDVVIENVFGKGEFDFVGDEKFGIMFVVRNAAIQESFANLGATIGFFVLENQNACDVFV
jgi:hypothetical protein